MTLVIHIEFNRPPRLSNSVAFFCDASGTDQGPKPRETRLRDADFLLQSRLAVSSFDGDAMLRTTFTDSNLQIRSVQGKVALPYSSARDGSPAWRKRANQEFPFNLHDKAPSAQFLP